MTKVDTAWLRMDSPSNLMMIVGVWTLQPAIGYDTLCERVQERLLKYNRFRQRVVEDAAGATWVEDRKFDIHHHVVREKLPRHRPGAEQQALQDHVGRLAMQPLDPKRPLWQIHLVEDYQGGSAMIVRIHHCIADGIALISVTMSLVDGGAPPPERKRKTAPAGAEDWIADMLIKPFTGMTVKALGAAGDGAAKSLGLLRDPQSGMNSSLEMAKLAYQVVSDAAALALMPDDSKTRLKGKPGRAKRVAWCQPIPLDEVKAVGRALNCSVNDVLLSCVAGAIGEYLKSFGDEVAGQEIRAMVPVNLRPIEQAYKLGNRFGLVPLVLPIGVDNPIERVYEVRRRMNNLKGSTQPLLAFGMLAVAGLLIKPAQDAMLNLFGRKTTAVMTNVPGPREKLKLCGATLEQSMFWVPQSGDIGLGVSILSYGGGVQFGVITDTTLCPDPQKIIDEFEPEFARLSIVTLMLPWDAAGA
ncbi:wax ester/triacylglycerol synthase family O-acyltransferase [Variovorax sp. CYS-02]|uniref:diacylglycerol O-acyltransferase n=2 Tax=Variovorax terrae TaxID=2923278 RepID=A0A9X1VX67_9BURK|nr:wax ester/triacylglycerol synthase family O-acyltransferase [Variovorax terrae]MCJ0764860.1 wax ester/triacylglycerol synthase family O-acyltransferase [Variovorax terrae]